MNVEMFNFWYFFWIVLSAAAIAGLYFWLRNKKPWFQKTILFTFLALGLLFHFLKVFIPPYSTNQARLLSDSWFINICGANIAVFPFIFLSKNKYAKEYMFYIGIISGFIALAYPTEALGKGDQPELIWDILRFYYHHWMIIAVPLLMVMLKLHTPSWKRILCAPTGLLILMLFIMLNQVLQSELGFICVRGDNFFDRDWKNSSYIWAPDTLYQENPDSIGKFLSIFCPKFFKEVPVGEYAGQDKFWPWFWMIFPVFILITPLSFGVSMIFDHKNFVADVKAFSFKKTWGKICGFFANINNTFKAGIKNNSLALEVAAADCTAEDAPSGNVAEETIVEPVTDGMTSESDGAQAE